MTLIEQIIQRCKEGNNIILVELFGRLMEVGVRMPATDKDDFVIVEIDEDQLDEAQEHLAGFKYIHISKVILPIEL